MDIEIDSDILGIDPLIWRQARLDNPDPDKLIPVPMVGFSELHRRLKHQEQQTKFQQNRLNVSEVVFDFSGVKNTSKIEMTNTMQVR